MVLPRREKRMHSGEQRPLGTGGGAVMCLPCACACTADGKCMLLLHPSLLSPGNEGTEMCMLQGWRQVGPQSGGSGSRAVCRLVAEQGNRVAEGNGVARAQQRQNGACVCIMQYNGPRSRPARNVLGGAGWGQVRGRRAAACVVHALVGAGQWAGSWRGSSDSRHSEGLRCSAAAAAAADGAYCFTSIFSMAAPIMSSSLRWSAAQQMGKGGQKSSG